MPTSPPLSPSSYVHFTAFPDSSNSSASEREGPSRPESPTPISPTRLAPPMQRNHPSPVLSRLLTKAATWPIAASTSAVASGILVPGPQQARQGLNALSQCSEHPHAASRRCASLLFEDDGAGMPGAIAMRHAGVYLSAKECGSVPARLKTLFAMSDETIDDVHEKALPFGRGNMFVDNRNAVTGRAWFEPKAFNAKEMAARSYLSEAAQAIQTAMGLAAHPVQWVLQRAAAAMFTGCATCTGYAAVFAALLTQRCASLDLSEQEDIRIELIGNPQLNDKLVDHVYCRVTYSAPGKDGQMQQWMLNCDPWAQMNRPMLASHSRFEQGIPVASIDVKTAGPVREGLRARLAEAERLYDQVKQSPDLRRSVPRARFRVTQAAPHGKFTMESSHFGWTEAEHLDFSRPGTVPLRKRRPTQLSAMESNLVQARALGANDRTPEKVAQVLLEHVDAGNCFKGWTDALALPSGASVMQAALTHRFDDGTTTLGKAIEFGSIDLLQAIEGVLRRRDMGGVSASDWREALLARDNTGQPALLQMLYKEGSLVESLPAAVVRSYAKLVQLLPEQERAALLEALFDGPGFAALAGRMSSASCDALLELLPPHGDILVRELLENHRERAGQASDED